MLCAMNDVGIRLRRLPSECVVERGHKIPNWRCNKANVYGQRKRWRARFGFRPINRRDKEGHREGPDRRCQGAVPQRMAPTNESLRAHRCSRATDRPCSKAQNLTRRKPRRTNQRIRLCSYPALRRALSNVCHRRDIRRVRTRRQCPRCLQESFRREIDLG